MRYLKHVLLGEGLDNEIKKVFISILGEDFKSEFLDFYDFYKIRGILEDDILKVSMFFEFENKWREIAKVNLNTHSILEHIDRNFLRELILKENRYLIENYDKELQRVTNIILSIIAFITGIGIALALLKFFS